jgi:hypothetical protein
LAFAVFWGVLTFYLGGCAVSNPRLPSKAETSFYQQLKQHCGQKLNGEVLYPTGKEAPFRGMPIWLELEKCSDKEIRMPININQKIYRTLILSQDKTNFTLRHENKRADGTQAEISMYGGQTADIKDTYLLLFPADGYSRQLLGAELNYAWSLAFNSDKSILSYMIENNGKLTLQIDFSLTKPLDK